MPSLTSTSSGYHNYCAVTYTLGGPLSAAFAVDKSTGVISVAQPLDREQTAGYLLTLEARDGGGMTAMVGIQVRA